MRIAFILLFLISFSLAGQNRKPPFRTWNTRSACAWVDPRSGWNLQLMFKKVHRNQERVLQEVRIGSREKDAEVVRPLGHASDGSYTELEMDWEGEKLRIESAQEPGVPLLALRVVRQTPQELPLRLILTLESIWGNRKPAFREGRFLKGGSWWAGALEKEDQDFCLPVLGAHLLVRAADTSYFYLHTLGKPVSRTRLNRIIQKQRERYYQNFKLNSDTGLARFAVQTCMAWNTIFDPTKNRTLHTVNRIWNVNRGGYVIFCWDNFFGSLLSLYGIGDTSLAFSNFRAVLEDATPEGFPSNNSQGNGRKSLDRSQPPVGGIVALRLYEQTKSMAFVRSVFPALFRWNRWWLERRMNNNLLSWGSHKSLNPFQDPSFNKLQGAMLESGIDDSPMYDSVGFDSEKGLMNMHDVGLNSLYLADCEALLAITEPESERYINERRQLKQSIATFRKELDELYFPLDGMYLNTYLPSGTPSRIYSPTLLYPMLTRELPADRVENLIQNLLLNPRLLGGEPGLPSISRNHPAFRKQRYWKGSVWAPLNYLVFKGLQKQGRTKEARNLAESSFKLFMDEYKRAKVICENYSGMNGRCDDPLVDSEPYYFWGGLLALMKAELSSVPE